MKNVLLLMLRVFNATFQNNISVQSRQAVLLVEETRIPVENGCAGTKLTTLV